jgi:peptidoglycan/LPS O-acetylase OafA/YrhL
VKSIKSLARIELLMTLTALALALISGLYLAITTFVEGENCYGISRAKFLCQPITSDNAPQTALRVTVVLCMMLGLFGGSALAAWAQSRARQTDARITAYMALVTCAVTVLAVTLSALESAGFFFLPGALVLLVTLGVGLVALLRSLREQPSSTAD